MDEKVPSKQEVMTLINEMHHASNYFQNHAPDLCRKGANMIEILYSLMQKESKNEDG